MRVGLDVGGTKTDGLVVDDEGAVRARTRRVTGWGPDAVLATVVSVVADLVESAGIDRGEIRSVGIGLPGQVEAGVVSHAVNLGIESLRLAEIATDALDTPVHVENDVKAATLGAATLRFAGEGGGASLAYVNLGTGVAAGFVLDGELHRGSGGIAGEIGHVSVDPRGPLCRCGQRGCIEALAGGGAIAARWGRPARLPVLEVFDAADAGDPRATDLRGDLVRGVAAAVRIIVLTVGVDTVILGGGISALRERLMLAVMAELTESAAHSAFLSSLGLEKRVELLPEGSPAAALGAALAGGVAGSSTTWREELTHG